MTTLTWLGEDDETIGYAGPSFTTWGGLKFPKDKPVEVDNADMIRRAKGNRFFEVHESAGTLDSASSGPPPPDPPMTKRGPGRPPKPKDGLGSYNYVPREPAPGED